MEEKTNASQDISLHVQQAAGKAVADSLTRRQAMIVLLWLMKRQVDADLE